MSMYEDLILKIYQGQNPYAGFDPGRHAGVWYNDPAAARPIFRRAIDRVCPTLIIEVGSFVGESAIFMADFLKATNRVSTCILCVDTWLGGIDHWTRVYSKLKFEFGRPTLYEQFLSNVINHGHVGTILPLTFDSQNAARLLTQLGISAQMVYIDGSHEAGDVLRDLNAYWKLLNQGGAMIVDDANGGFPGVTADLALFLENRKIPVEMDGEKALLIK